MDIESRIADLAAPGAAAAGLVVDGVAVSAAGKHSRVLITVDLPETEIGSASLDAIAEASRVIGAALDDASVPSGPYTLEVSTPGTSRPLTERRHFMRARTRLVVLDLADGTTATGRLTDVDGDDLVIDDGARIPLDSVVRGEIQVEFKKLDG